MSFIFEMVLRSSLVLAIGLTVASALRNRPAALRHWVLMATLAMAAAQPAFNLIVPAWGMALAGSPGSVEGTPVVEANVGFEIPAPTKSVTPAAKFQWLAFAYQIWMIGVVIGLAVLLIGAAWLTLLTARSSDAGAAWQSAADDVRRQLGIRRRVRIAVTQHPAMLVTWGVIAPVILLPRSAMAWPAERIALVLAHELAHLARRDWLVQLLAEMLRAINWFNPLFWIACARLRRESEHACDDVVLALGTGGTTYASHLVDLARSFSAHGRTWLPAPSIARPSTLERRVRAMLNPQLDRHPVSMKTRFAVALLLLAIAVPIAAATQTQAVVTGSVEDPSGKPLIDATVRISAVNSDAVFETRSDATGAFQLSDVPPGDYMISGRAMGFSGQRQRIRVSGATTFALRLSVGTLRETITVTGPTGSGPIGSRTGSSAPKPNKPACSTSEVGGHITPPVKVRDVRPRFKQAWTDNNLTGEVLLQARIGLDGKVSAVEVVSGVNAEMEDEAIAAVSQWEFSPTYLNCEPIEVRMYVSVAFKLDR